jgi:hypothetical protein
LHRAYEAETLSRERFDQTLLLPRIADCVSGSVEASRQRPIGHDASIPDRVDKIVLADDAISIADQVIKQSENLWRRRDQVSPATEFAPVDIENVILEEIAQGTIPQMALVLRALEHGLAWKE